MGKLINIKGKKFNRWTVIEQVKNKNSREALWKCQCDCGTIRNITGSHLRLGHRKSCGCLRNELIQKRKQHPLSTTPEYFAWKNIKYRCYNKNNKDYKNYGKRGITVSKRWLNSFDEFYKDMGQRPSDNHSLERIENNKGYCKSNCKWATRKEQNNNKRNNIHKNTTKHLHY